MRPATVVSRRSALERVSEEMVNIFKARRWS
jgi:hypothetical protein